MLIVLIGKKLTQKEVSVLACISTVDGVVANFTAPSCFKVYAEVIDVLVDAVEAVVCFGKVFLQMGFLIAVVFVLLLLEDCVVTAIFII